MTRKLKPPHPKDLAKRRALSIIGGGSYDLPPFDLKNCIVCLSRFLFIRTPDGAELSWWTGTQKQPVGKWIEIRKNGAPPYYIFSDGVRGRSSPRAPAGVKAKDMVVIKAPARFAPILQDYYRVLVGQLNRRDAADAPWIEVCERRVEVMRQMRTPEYRDATFRRYMRIMAAGLKANEYSEATLEQCRAKVLGDYTNFFLDGLTAADLLLALAVTKAILPFRFMFEPMFTPAVLFNAGSIRAFLDDVLARSQIPGQMVDAITQVCIGLQTEGENTQDVSAPKAASIGEFYGHLYGSAVPLRAAMVGFRFVALDQDAAGAPQSVQIAMNVCEERGVVAATSMAHQFEDSMDHRHILSRREHIAMLRQTKGESAARDYLDQTLDTEMLYPPIAREFLDGGTMHLPTIAP